MEVTPSKCGLSFCDLANGRDDASVPGGRIRRGFGYTTATAGDDCRLWHVLAGGVWISERVGRRVPRGLRVPGRRSTLRAPPGHRPGPGLALAALTGSD